MSVLEPINQQQLLAEGIDTINRNFNTLLNIAQSVNAADNNSGLVAPVTLDRAPANYLLNSGFEMGNLSGWQQDDNAGGDLADTAVVDTVATSGRKALQVVAEDQNFRVYQSIEVAAGGLFSVGGKIKVASAAAGTQSLLRVAFYDAADALVSEETELADMTNIAGWQHLKIENLTVPAGAVAAVVSAELAEPGELGFATVYWDDLQVNKLAALAAYTDNNDLLVSNKFVVPEAAAGLMLALDHGIFLAAPQFSIRPGLLSLDYEPAEPLAVQLTWSGLGAGITTPRALTRISGENERYWQLPEDYSTNVLVFDHGLILRRDQYQIDGDRVILNYVPSDQPAGFQITAAWGAGGPGITPPVALERLPGASELDTRFWQLPEDSGDSVLVFDHGIALDAQDYVVDYKRRVVTLSYTPTGSPFDIAASWGFTMDGLFLENAVLSPNPNGSTVEFIIPQDPVVNSVRIRAKLLNGQVVYYKRGVDFTVEGRKIRFAVAPPAFSTLFASMMAVVLNQDLTVSKVNNFEAVAWNAPGIGTLDQGNKLVAVGPDGKLPTNIVPNVPTIGGFSAVSTTDASVGTSAAQDKIIAVGADGRYTNAPLPQDMVLGATNLALVETLGLELDINSLSEKYEYNADGSLKSVKWLDGAQVPQKTISYEYNADLTLKKRTDVVSTFVNTRVGTQTVTRTVVRTYTYNGDGTMSVAKTVS
jgi:hypothetical protein